MLDVIEGHAGAAWRRSAIFACVLALFAALGAVHAGSASALGEQCSGSNAKGVGSFLQAQAQGRWSSGGEIGFNGSAHPQACSGSQGSGGTPAVSYVPLSSATALRQWGAEDGSLHPEELGYVPNFIGTDIAPSGPVGQEGTMLAKMKGALGSDVAVVPVTQTAIAIAANPPALPAHPPCVVSRINAVQLQKVFLGEIKNWRQLGAASDSTLGGDCDQAITRIVRGESAGTTYQFKHYLNSINPSPLACTGNAKRTWAQLQAPFGGATPANVEWPRNAGCQEGEGPVTTVAPAPNEGEHNLAYVAANPGTITYGSLPEARQNAPKQIIEVHNGVKPSSPMTGTGEANCGGAHYTLPAGWEAGVNVDWSQVYGSNPNSGAVAKDAYPICTLSWDVAATDRFSEGVATTVHDYHAFATAKSGGQAAVRALGYRDLPAPVAEAAAAAIAQIGGIEEEEEEEGGTGTVLCSAEPEMIEGVLTCPKGEGFNEGKVVGGVAPETVATFTSGAGPKAEITCPQGYYIGEFNEDGTSAGGIFEFGWGQSEGCTTNFPENPEAVVSFENPPFDTSRFVFGGPTPVPEGHFLLTKTEAAPMLRIQSSVTCVYVPISLNNEIYNGSPTRMLMVGQWSLIEGEEACPTILNQTAWMTVTATGSENPLYLAAK